MTTNTTPPANATATASAGFRRLVERNAPLWAGEAEVIRTYWHSPKRTRDTDRQWVMRQLYKEYWDGILPPLAAMQRMLPELERGVTRQQLCDLAEVIHEEVEHFAMFADLYDLLRHEGEPSPDPETIKRLGNWPGNEALMAVRSAHRKAYGKLGQRAFHLTEGGYCALFTEGRKLKGRGGVDDRIATICAAIYDDEFEHMLLGIVGVGDAPLADAEWDLLGDMTVEQMRARIRMRNEQFGFPVSPARIEELVAGKAEPVAFDYAYAEKLRAGR